MREELTQKLYTDFPALFAQRNLPQTQTQMCYGFQCGDGWFDLIYRLSSEITAIITADPSLDPGEFQVSCVKEKFGGLRFYISRSTDEIMDCYVRAMEESRTVCEMCGKKGKLREKGWMQTLCDECQEERKRQRPGIY